MDEMFNYFNGVNESHRKMGEEYNRLVAERIPPVVRVGDRVIVAVGLISRGHLWVRRVCTVLEVAENSCHVRCDQAYQGWDEWIDNNLITDVLPKGELVEAERKA